MRNTDSRVELKSVCGGDDALSRGRKDLEGLWRLRCIALVIKLAVTNNLLISYLRLKVIRTVIATKG